MAAESIGNLVPTKIPGYADAADIQAALRVYHYGSYTYDPNETNPANLVNPSIAYTINDLQDQIDNIIPGIPDSVLTAKGDLISASSSSTVSILSLGSAGQYLRVNTATTTGLEWGALPSATTSGAGIVQLSDSTASTSTTLAATANALKTTYDLANGAIQKTLTTTIGDIIYASSANTPARLGIGSTGQVLTVAGGVPTWATSTGGGSASLPDIFLMMGG